MSPNPVESPPNAPELPNRQPWIEIRPSRPNFRADTEADTEAYVMATC